MRRATVRTPVPEPGVVARAVRPDNTPEMTTRVVDTDEGRAVHTDIEREGTAGLRTTLDDYTVNIAVATETVRIADRHTP